MSMKHIGHSEAEIKTRRDINDNFRTLNEKKTFGDVDGGNYTEFTSDGTMRRVGTATAWKDMIGDLFGRRLLSAAGTVDYDYAENAIVFSENGGITDANDRVGGNIEINHELKVGTDITFRPHLHWWQVITNETSVTDENWTAPTIGLSTELLHVPINGTVVVQDSGDSITYTEDTDYSVNYTTGEVTNITLTPAATYHIDYDYITGTVTTNDYIMTMRYRIQRNNAEKVTSWTTVTCDMGSGGDDVFDLTAQPSGTYNQISRFPDIVATVGVSDTIQFQMTRTDAVEADMSVYFMDIHAEVDSDGSDTELVKA